MTESYRAIRSIALRHATPNKDVGEKPTIEWVDPETLFVEEIYQRNISSASITLIHRIVRAWSWYKMKPPICARGKGDRLYVIDGQHTAIAAASHGGVKKIPIIVLDIPDGKTRAEGFVSHNSERLNITPMQSFYAAVAAGNETACGVIEAAKRAGAVVAKYPPAHGIFKAGETVATAALCTLFERRGPDGAYRILKILAKANRAPIKSVEIHALSELLYGQALYGKIDTFNLGNVLREHPIDETLYKLKRKMISEQKTIPMARAIARFYAAQLKKE